MEMRAVTASSGRAANSFDMAFTKVIPLKESRVLEFRAQATNIFNIRTIRRSTHRSIRRRSGGSSEWVPCGRITITARFRF